MAARFSRACPQCTQLVTWPDSKTYPFCSDRCRLIDLGVWATGGYRIASENDVEEDHSLEQEGWEPDVERF